MRIKLHVLLTRLGRPFAPHLMFYNIVTNVICSLVFGHRFEYGDENFEKLMNSFGSCLKIEASVCAQVQPLQLIDKGHYFVSFNNRTKASFACLLHSTALQLLSSPDGVFAGATPDSEAHLPKY